MIDQLSNRALDFKFNKDSVAKSRFKIWSLCKLELFRVGNTEREREVNMNSRLCHPFYFSLEMYCYYHHSCGPFCSHVLWHQGELKKCLRRIRFPLHRSAGKKGWKKSKKTPLTKEWEMCLLSLWKMNGNLTLKKLVTVFPTFINLWKTATWKNWWHNFSKVGNTDMINIAK